MNLCRTRTSQTLRSLNLFIYALNNPLSKSDLDGHDWKQRVQQAKKWMADHPRTMSGVKAVGAAVVTTVTVAAIVVTAPVSVPATLVGAAAVGLGTATAAIAATGGAVATVTYTAAAVTGDQSLDKAAGVVQNVTNPAGYAATLASGGNTELGGGAASASDVMTGDPVAAGLGAVDLTSDMLSGAASAAGQTQIEQPPTNTHTNPDPVLPPAKPQQQ